MADLSALDQSLILSLAFWVYLVVGVIVSILMD
jgi:hypothetical protein